MKEKFHLWHKLIIKGLEYEERYPPGRERHFHETMDKFNDTLFRSVRSGKVSDQAATIDNDEPDVEDDFERKLEEIMKAESAMESTTHQELVGLLCSLISRKLILR